MGMGGGGGGCRDCRFRTWVICRRWREDGNVGGCIDGSTWGT